MKNPKFGRNKIQTFIEFDTPSGHVRFGEESNRMFIEVGEEKTYLTDSNGVVTAGLASLAALATLATTAEVISGTPTVKEYTKIVTLTPAQIVGTGAGSLGHSGGAVLVPAPASGFALEFVSAVLIYDYDTAAYTGGAGDDLVANVGSVAVSPSIATTDLITAGADQIVQLKALAVNDYDIAEAATINLTATEVTQPGTAAGVIRVHVIYKQHETGL